MAAAGALDSLSTVGLTRRLAIKACTRAARSLASFKSGSRSPTRVINGLRTTMASERLSTERATTFSSTSRHLNCSCNASLRDSSRPDLRCTTRCWAMAIPVWSSKRSASMSPETTMSSASESPSRSTAVASCSASPSSSASSASSPSPASSASLSPASSASPSPSSPSSSSSSSSIASSVAAPQTAATKTATTSFETSKFSALAMSDQARATVARVDFCCQGAAAAAVPSSSTDDLAKSTAAAASRTPPARTWSMHVLTDCKAMPRRISPGDVSSKDVQLRHNDHSALATLSGEASSKARFCSAAHFEKASSRRSRNSSASGALSRAPRRSSSSHASAARAYALSCVSRSSPRVASASMAPHRWAAWARSFTADRPSENSASRLWRRGPKSVSSNSATSAATQRIAASESRTINEEGAKGSSSSSSAAALGPSKNASLMSTVSAAARSSSAHGAPTTRHRAATESMPQRRLSKSAGKSAPSAAGWKMDSTANRK
mmetsp:Transcript_18557/g.63860  ORF Transcript_18557/g.63860 Transcript_18557/m.63860 type:complete len:495 (-) Transcript_18557:704-2188(-)